MQKQLFNPTHIGTLYDRAAFAFGIDCLETMLLRHWHHENVRRTWLNRGYATLESIISDRRPDGTIIEREITERDAFVAASVIQWIGTNCGGAFVSEATKAADAKRAEIRLHAKRLRKMFEAARDRDATVAAFSMSFIARTKKAKRAVINLFDEFESHTVDTWEHPSGYGVELLVVINLDANDGLTEGLILSLRTKMDLLQRSTTDYLNVSLSEHTLLSLASMT